jgi:hypothetical protein
MPITTQVKTQDPGSRGCFAERAWRASAAERQRA